MGSPLNTHNNMLYVNETTVLLTVTTEHLTGRCWFGKQQNSAKPLSGQLNKSYSDLNREAMNSKSLGSIILWREKKKTTLDA